MPVESRDPERRRADDERAADRLDRAWDALVAASRAADQPDHPGGPPDPLLLAVRRFHALDDSPAPDPDFTAQLRRHLTGTSERRSISGMRLGLLPTLRRPAWVQVAAAIVFVVALASGHLGGGDGVPAVSASPTFDPHPTATALSRTACRTESLGDGATDVAAEMIPAPTSAPCRDGGE